MYAAKCNNGKVEMYPCHGVNAFYYSVQCFQTIIYITYKFSPQLILQKVRKLPVSISAVNPAIT